MKSKKATLLINPRAGQNLARLSDVLAVLSAAGWSTKIALKEYGGHTIELATEATEEGSDLVIAYGGDGTLNQVVNGVMNAQGQHSIVAVIPGGTANVWASEIGIPNDPVKASLTLINSDARMVDIGHVEVESLTFPNTTSHGQQQNGKKMHQRNVKASFKARHHFLLMAGLGIDAAVMGHVSKPLKYRIGPLAVGISAAKKIPTHQPFPVEIQVGDSPDVSWKGEALQVVIGNTRRYANIVEMTPDAYIDDGILDVCVITAGDPLTTIDQIASLLLRRKPNNLTAKYFHGARLSISVPASIHMQLDGSAVKLKDYVSEPGRDALEHAGDLEHVMVTYRFDTMPRALRVAIPRSYNNTLFEKSADSDDTAHPQASTENATSQPEQQNGKASGQAQQGTTERADPFLANGCKVTVVGVSPDSAKKDTYIVAGTTTKQSTGETRPVAVLIDEGTTIMKQTGESVSHTVVSKLQEGETIVVEGKKSKRGVIRAKSVVI